MNVGVLTTNEIQSAIDETLLTRYEDFYLDFPAEIGNRLCLPVAQYPTKLMHLRRKYYPCPDGSFREPTRAMQYFLHDIGYISEFSDTCSNIPWRFFKNFSDHTKPIDPRVQFLIKYFSSHGISKRNLHRVFNSWNGKGAPDICDFSFPLQGIEVKALGDRIFKDQVHFHRLVEDELDFKVRLLELQEVSNERSYRRRRTILAKDKKPQFNEVLLNKTLKKKLEKLFDYFDQHPYLVRKVDPNGYTFSFLHNPFYLSQALNIICINDFPLSRLQFSEDDIFSLSLASFNGGYIHWWMIPIFFIPWIEKGKLNQTKHI